MLLPKHIVLVIGIACFVAALVFLNSQDTQPTHAVSDSRGVHDKHIKTFDRIQMNMQRGAHTFPEQWGAPPKMQTRDIRPLPEPYGMGSSTLLSWINKNIEKDNANADGSVTETSSTSKPVITLEGEAPWDSLVGQDADEAVKALTVKFEKLNVVKVPEGSIVTMDYRLDRVRVFFGEDGKVVRAPSLG